MKLSHMTTGKKKSKKQSAKATLAEVMKEMDESQSGYVGKRISVYGLRIDALIVKHNVEK